MASTDGCPPSDTRGNACSCPKRQKKVCTIVGLAADFGRSQVFDSQIVESGSSPFPRQGSLPFHFSSTELLCCKASALPRSLPLCPTHTHTPSLSLVSSLPNHFELYANPWEGRELGPQQKLVIVLVCLADRRRATGTSSSWVSKLLDHNPSQEHRTSKAVPKHRRQMGSPVQYVQEDLPALVSSLISRTWYWQDVIIETTIKGGGGGPRNWEPAPLAMRLTTLHPDL
ncbi:hypothetical protein J3F83DRAFT_29240 [Trichoderma novae-zelandiae]